MGKIQKKLIVGSIIIVSAISFLIYTAIETSAYYTYTVCEIKSMGTEVIKRSIRIEGKVSPDTYESNKTKLIHKFHIIDDPEISSDCDKSIPVIYEGLTPDLMQGAVVRPEDLDVIVEGSIDSSGIFTATRLMTKCPRVYDPIKEVEKLV